MIRTEPRINAHMFMFRYTVELMCRAGTKRTIRYDTLRHCDGIGMQSREMGGRQRACRRVVYCIVRAYVRACVQICMVWLHSKDRYLSMSGSGREEVWTTTSCETENCMWSSIVRMLGGM